MKKIFLILLITLSVGFFVSADEISEQMDAVDFDSLSRLSESAKEFDENFDYKTETEKTARGEQTEAEPVKIINRIISLFSGSLKSGISDMGKIILSLIIFGILLRFLPEGSGRTVAFYVTYTVVFTIGLYVFEEVCVTAKDLIEQLGFFIKGALPVMVTLSVPCGQTLGILRLISVISGICIITDYAGKMLLPLCGIMASLSAANSLSGEISFKGAEKTAKKIVMWSIGIIMTVFLSLFTVKGVTGAALDNMAGKTVKFAVGNFIPVVGGIIKDSLESIVTYTSFIKSACGAAGVIALVYMVLPPILKIGGMLLAFRLTVIVSSPFTDERITGTIDGFADILSLVLTITTVSAILFIIAMGSLAL